MYGNSFRPLFLRCRPASSCLSHIGLWFSKLCRQLWHYTPGGCLPRIGPSVNSRGGDTLSNHLSLCLSGSSLSSGQNVLLIEKAPDNLVGLLFIILIGSAGRSIVIGDYWYHYRRGKFCRDHIRVLMRRRGYVVRGQRQASISDFVTCENLIGQKWRLNRNCVTELGSLWTT